MTKEELCRRVAELENVDLFIVDEMAYTGNLNDALRVLAKYRGEVVGSLFGENEELSDHGSEVKYFAKVTSDEYIIPNARQVKYFSSKFKLMDGFQGLYSVEHVDLYGSQLATITPPSITCITMENHSKAIINLKEQSKYGGIELSGVAINGEETELIIKAEVEDKVKEGEFVLRVTGGSNNKIELDLRNLKIKLFKLYFHRSGINNYIHVKLNKNTDVKSMYLDCETEGVKIIIEGGKDIDVYDLVDNRVDYEVI